MSGFEILGAVAGASQLVVYIFGVIDSILELQDHIKHGPARIRSYSDRLGSLSNVIQYIKNNGQLCTQVITTLLHSISKEVDALNIILRTSFPAVTRKSPTKYLKIPQEKKAEKRIKDSLAALDGYKIDLMLCISSILKEVPANNPMASASIATSEAETLVPFTETRLALRTNTDDSHTTAASNSSTSDSKPSAHETEDPPEGWPISQDQAENGPLQIRFIGIKANSSYIGAIGTGVTHGYFQNSEANGNTISAIGPTDFNGIERLLKSVPKLPIPARFNRA